MESQHSLSSTDLLSFDDLSNSDSDFELPVKPTKRKKQAELSSLQAKRPRRKDASRGTTPSQSSSPIPSTPEASQEEQSSQGTPIQALHKPAKRAVNCGDHAINANDIYIAVVSGTSDLVAVVDEWLDYYKQRREQGLLVLINFIIQCCGCQGVVSREMHDSMQNAEIIATLTRQFNERSSSYPLSGKSLSLKRFRASLCEFARILVRLCQNSIIYDDYLLPSLLSFLTGLSDSQVRAFRHTSTLIAMKLMSGIVKVGVAVSLQLQTIQRRYNLEQGKDVKDQDPQRLEELKVSISELLENNEELSSMMNATFRGVFVHRYRDRLVEIRAACMEELGIWLRTDPENFLNDGCLKYLGWMMNDKKSMVRLQCVRNLQGLYVEEEFIGRLELFTSRFKKRMLNMVMDQEYKVAVEVIKLLVLIHQSTNESLQEEECAHIYPLVYATNHSLASAAGSFLYMKLRGMIDSENERGTNSAFFRVLAAFSVQSEFHEHGTYLVDSLWEAADSELKDWHCMTTLLLQEDGLMNEEEEDALIDLMICAIQRAAEAKPPVGRISEKKELSVKQKKTQEHNRQRITAHFIPLLTQLLAKYSANAGKVRLLLRVPLYFALDMYNSTQRMEKHLDQLLYQICLIVEKHTDTAVLEACTKLVDTLCSDRHSFSSRSHLAFSQLFDSLTEHFNTYYSDLMQAPTDDDVFSASMALKRIAALVSAKNLSGQSLFDCCMDLIQSRMESRHLDEELVVAALRCSAFHLMWAKVNLPSLPTQEEVKRLKMEVRSFCKICQAGLSLGQTEIRDQAFELLCDLLVLYSANSVRSEPALQNLYYQPSYHLRAEMAAFLLDYIFLDEIEVEDDQEQEIKLLHKKRNQLAGYCKLVIFGVMDLTAATTVFKYYDKNFKDFGDIIKETIMKTKLINPVMSARTLCLSMQQLFTEMLSEGGSRRDFDEIRGLARKLAMTFENNRQSVRKPMVALHMDGIRFAFLARQEEGEQHPNVAFLEILSVFSYKLLPQDKAPLAAYLKSQCPAAALSWQPVNTYQRSLEGSSAKFGQKSAAVSPENIPVAKRRKTDAPGSVATSKKDFWSDNSSIPSGVPTPILTSTTLGPSEDVILQSDLDSGLTEPECGDEFSSRSEIQDVMPTSRLSSTADQKELHTQLTLLSLNEDDFRKQGEAESDEYESDSSHVPHSPLSRMYP
ncbi:cohesin subunit SA-1 [Hippocampus zosterae]|uniref:cohesin subunit SA-1 n=1 Tax=Hippocampus zosterae TaxID=109293 RepID=UPI00223DE288|nr:cohesin subunit SA-1 [Hippocampus zosterae]